MRLPKRPGNIGECIKIGWARMIPIENWAKPKASAPLASDGPGWTTLSAMEEEHLCTRASVPYRDPQGDDKAEIIQQRRELGQQSCGLESTSAWQRRWLMK